MTLMFENLSTKGSNLWNTHWETHIKMFMGWSVMLLTQSLLRCVHYSVQCLTICLLNWNQVGISSLLVGICIFWSIILLSPLSSCHFFVMGVIKGIKEHTAMRLKVNRLPAEFPLSLYYVLMVICTDNF